MSNNLCLSLVAFPVKWHCLHPSLNITLTCFTRSNSRGQDTHTSPLACSGDRGWLMALSIQNMLGGHVTALQCFHEWESFGHPSCTDRWIKIQMPLVMFLVLKWMICPLKHTKICCYFVALNCNEEINQHIVVCKLWLSTSWILTFQHGVSIPTKIKQ